LAIKDLSRITPPDPGAQFNLILVATRQWETTEDDVQMIESEDRHRIWGESYGDVIWA
jgi:hypothetical protein